jgi:AcrR family transcriptional regulator
VPAAVAPGSLRDLPVRPAGTRARSGNAMHRSRTAILQAAGHCVERYGVRRTTMGDIALKAGVAKATLYNHFRTKDDVLAALLQAHVARLGGACREVAAGRPLPAAVPGLAGPDVGSGLGAALRVAAAAVAASGPLRRVVADEPELAAALATPTVGAAWDLVRGQVVDVLAAAGARADRPAVDLVLRWLAGQVLWPASAEEVALAAPLLGAGLAP